MQVKKALYFFSGGFKAISLYCLIFSISRKLGLHTAGEFFFFMAIISFLSVVFPAGLNSLIIRNSYNTHKAKYFLNSSFILITTLTLLSTIVVAPFYSTFAIVFFYAGVKSLSITYESYQLARQDYLKLSLYIINVATHSIIMAVVLLLDMFENLSLTEMFLFLSFSELIIYVFFVRKEIAINNIYRIVFSFQKMKKSYKLKYIIYILLMSIFGVFLSVGDRFILGVLVEKNDLAKYALIYTAIGSAHRFFSLPYIQIISQIYFRDGDSEMLAERINRGLLLLVATSVLIIIAYFFVYQQIGLLEPYYIPMSVLVISVFFNYLFLANQIFLKKKYLSNQLFKIQLALAISTVVLNLALIPYYGWKSCAFITLAIYIFAYILSKYKVMKMRSING